MYDPQINRRVVVVDDEAPVRQMVSALCGMHGYAVVGEAGNGIDAESIVSTTKPNFVILDHMMPFQDGARTATKIRKLSPDSRIIAFSAVLLEKPAWADAWLPKTEVDRLPDLLESMIGLDLAAIRAV